MFKRLLLAFLVCLLPVAVRAETKVISFSDLKNCPLCEVIERNWRSQPVRDLLSKLRRPRVYIDVADPKNRNVVREAKVDRWPTTFLVEVNKDNQVTHIYRRHVGAMTVKQLTEFVQVPASDSP